MTRSMHRVKTAPRDRHINSLLPACLSDRMSFHLTAVDNEELIHEAVRQGHHLSLEIYLTQNPQCANKTFTYHQCQWTPLLAACFYKHVSIVRMLLKRFSVDVEATGTIVFDLPSNNPEKVEDVSALWTAAAVDSFEIVRLLIEEGKANVNHRTRTYSTAARVACYNNNLPMLEYLLQQGANPYQGKIGNYTNLMLSAGRGYLSLVKYLVEQLHCDVNERDENGQGALYYAVKSGSVEIVTYLLEHGAKNVRDTLRHVTPLMRAALYGKIDLVQAFEGRCSDLEWIEGIELLGATFAGWIAPIEDLHKTVEYLRQAFRLRDEKNLPKVIESEPLEIFDYRSECSTLEEFNQLVALNCSNALRIESIRIHYRLLGERSNDYHYVLRYYGAFLADDFRLVDCAHWWLYEFELKQKWTLYIDKEHLRWLMNIFIEMQHHQTRNLSLDLLFRALKVIDRETRSADNELLIDYNLHTLLYCITLTAQTFDRMNFIPDDPMTIDRNRIEELVEKLIERGYQTRTDGSSLLHLACSSSTVGITTFTQHE